MMTDIRNQWQHSVMYDTLKRTLNKATVLDSERFSPKAKPTKKRKIAKSVIAVSFTNSFFFLAYFSPLFCDCFLFLLYTLSVCLSAQRVLCCSGSRLQHEDGYFCPAARHLGGRFKLLEVQTHRQIRLPPSHQDKHKDSAKTKATFLSSSLSQSEFQGQRCLCGPSSSIIIPLLIFRFYFFLHFLRDTHPDVVVAPNSTNPQYSTQLTSHWNYK